MKQREVFSRSEWDMSISTMKISQKFWEYLKGPLNLSLSRLLEKLEGKALVKS